MGYIRYGEEFPGSLEKFLDEIWLQASNHNDMLRVSFNELECLSEFLKGALMYQG